MNDYTDSTTTDSTSNSNHGYKKGAGEPAITTGGKFGKAQHFDNINDYIYIRDNATLDITTAITLESWCYADTVSGAGLGDGIIAKTAFANGHGAYQMMMSGATPSHWAWNLSGPGEINSSATNPAANNWYYYVSRYERNAVWNEYVNNSSVANSTSYTSSIGADNNNVNIGRYYGGDRYFDGIIDEVRISKIARSTGYMTTVYNNTNIPTTFALEQGVTEIPGGAPAPSIETRKANIIDFSFSFFFNIDFLFILHQRNVNPPILGYCFRRRSNLNLSFTIWSRLTPTYVKL